MSFDVSYGITRHLAGLSIHRAKELVTEALKLEGFGILTEIDVAATLKAKLEIDRPPYLILGACNPKLARDALDREPAIGLLLPCNVVIAKGAGEVVVSAASPRVMFGIVHGADQDLAGVAAEAEDRLNRAMDRLEQMASEEHGRR
jgi:uncharacterized protein (DUF302 family)